MTKPMFDAQAHMMVMQAALGLTMEKGWEAGVIDNLRRAHQIALAFLEFPLADEVEPASTFEVK